MKTGSILAALVASASAHTIFQKVSVNGADQGQLKGIRAPANNNPVTDVMSSDIICNAVTMKDSNVLTVPAGAKVGHWWGHEIGGASGPNDADNPIASSHKGEFPPIFFLAYGFGRSANVSFFQAPSSSTSPRSTTPPPPAPPGSSGSRSPKPASATANGPSMT